MAATANGLTVTKKELVEAAPFIQAISTFTVPEIRAVAALATIKRKAAGYLEDIEAARKALVDKHVCKDESGKAMTLPDNTYDLRDLAAFSAEWNALLAETLTLTNCRAIKMSEFAGATQLVKSKDDKTPPEILRGVPADLLFGLGPFVIDDLSVADTAVPEPTVSASK